MQQFHNIRKQNQMRTEKIRRGQDMKSKTHASVRARAGLGRKVGSLAATTGHRVRGKASGGGAPSASARGARGGQGRQGRTMGRPRPKIGSRVGGYKKTTGGSRNTGPPPRGASRFPAVKGATGRRPGAGRPGAGRAFAGGRSGGRAVGGSGFKAARAKVTRKAW